MVKSSSAGATRQAKKLRAPKVLKVATEFSGMEAPIMAIKGFTPHVFYKHVSSSDINPSCQKLIEHMFQPEILCKDVSVRPVEEAVYSDCYVWGAPCVAFSSNGRQDGIKSAKGRLVQNALKYIEAKLPRLSVMENVPTLAEWKKFRPVFQGILKTMKTLGYVTTFRVLSSSQYSVPQDRRRLYMVSIRADSLHRPMTWPEPTGSVTLQSVLTDCEGDKAGRLPRNKAQRAHVEAAYKAAWNQGVNPLKTPVAVDIDCGEKFRSYGVDEARTLTKSRGGQGGPWISTKGRRTSIEEMFAIQGFDAQEYASWAEAGVSKSQMGQMLGNTMSLPVIAGVLAEALWASGLVASKPAFEGGLHDR